MGSDISFSIGHLNISVDGGIIALGLGSRYRLIMGDVRHYRGLRIGRGMSRGSRSLDLHDYVDVFGTTGPFCMYSFSPEIEAAH